MNTQLTDAGEYTLTTGLNRGNHYVYVTHRNSGKQWMSKSSVDAKYDLSIVSANVELGITKFYPDRPIVSCDSRFWMPVKAVV
jgi:hypothetical protein